VSARNPSESETPSSSRRSGRAQDVPGVTSAPERAEGKGRPTRTRREAEAARRRPIVVTDRKEARRRDRARAAEDRQRSQQAMMTGDEANMPAQHRGRARSYVRDIVDTRRNIAEFFFPVALILMLVALILPLVMPSLYTSMSVIMLVVLWGGIVLCVIDSLILRRRIRSRLTERFGEVPQGVVGYGIMRSLQIRRWRLPRAQVRHGDQPR
jgi:Flp pilus assembly protein TadB